MGNSLTMLSIAIVLGSSTILLMLWSIFRHVFSRTRAVPGPFLARFTDLWFLWRTHTKHLECDLLALHRRHGPVVRYGPNRFSICHPDAGRTLYGLGQQNLAKSDWYSTWGDPIGKAPRYPPLFPELDVARHARNRRLFQSAYALSALVGYEPAVDACGDLFSARLREFAAAGHEGRKKKGEREGAVAINMGHWLQCYAFDVIGLVTYSRRIGFLDRGEDVGGVMKTIEKVATYATLAGVYPWVHPYYFAARQWFQGRAVDGRQYIINWAVASVQEHKEAAASAQQQNESKKAQDTGRNSSGENKPQEEIGGKENEEEVAIGAPDFLTKFFAKHDAYPEAFTPAHILTGTLANIFAGSDTTGIGLSGTLYQLLRNPSALLKLRQEVDNYVSSLPQQQRLNDNEGGGYHISFKATQEDMPYLQAVIKESLRLHIATGMVLERMVPKGGITLAGTFFPEGSRVGIHPWVEHRAPDYFGEDADSFVPERWLTDDSEKLALMNRHWMPFGIGARTCIGRHISHLEISKLIPRLVRDFDFALSGKCADPAGGWTTENFGFIKPRDFKVQVKERWM